MQEFPERKSLSLVQSNIINVPIQETEEFESKQEVADSTSFKYDDQTYNLRGLKRRTKYSKKIQGMTGLKWNVISTEQNYSNNLPMIGKTRMNISNDSCSLDQLSIDMINRNNKYADYILMLPIGFYIFKVNHDKNEYHHKDNFHRKCDC